MDQTEYSFLAKFNGNKEQPTAYDLISVTNDEVFSLENTLIENLKISKEK